MNNIFYKKYFYTILLILISILFTFYYGFIGVYPIDSFLIYDAGYKITTGNHPFKNYWSITGPILDYIQYFFFKIFGVSWFSYVLHSATINLLATLIFFHFFNQINLNLFYSFIYSLSISILAYPSVGTPFMDHHAVIFSAISVVFLILAFIKDKNIYWFFIPIFLFASFLSKQIPSSYLLILFLISICIFSIFFSTKNYKNFTYLFYGGLLSIFFLLLIFFINNIPIKNFLVQYFLYPLEIGKDRSSAVEFDLNNVIFQFKFIYFSLIPIGYILFKLIRDSYSSDVKKDIFILVFILSSVSLFIFAQLMTKNQILIFFLIPLILGISHYFCDKYLKNKLFIYFLVTILIISTIKFHLRFNENKKFMELANIDLKLAVDSVDLDESLANLKWITPKYPKNPQDEIRNLIEIKEIILSDKTKKIIISDYQILPSILKLNTVTPNKWFDNLSVPNKDNKYFKEYKNFFIKNLISQKIETIFVFKDEEVFLEGIFQTNCYTKENIKELLFKMNIKKCLE